MQRAAPTRHNHTMANRLQRRRRARRGFTLIETALAVVIVGTGVLAMMAAQQAFHQKNAWSTHVSTATALGNELREMTFNLPRHDPVTGSAVWGPEANEVFIGDYDDLDDFDGLADFADFADFAFFAVARLPFSCLAAGTCTSTKFPDSAPRRTRLIRRRCSRPRPPFFFPIR